MRLLPGSPSAVPCPQRRAPLLAGLRSVTGLGPCRAPIRSVPGSDPCRSVPGSAPPGGVSLPPSGARRLLLRALPRVRRRPASLPDPQPPWSPHRLCLPSSCSQHSARISGAAWARGGAAGSGRAGGCVEGRRGGVAREPGSPRRTVLSAGLVLRLCSWQLRAGREA